MYRELLNYLATKHQSDVNPTSGTFAFDLTCEVKNDAFSRYFAFVGISAKLQKQPVLARAFLSFQRQLPIKRVLKLNECTVHTFKKIICSALKDIHVKYIKFFTFSLSITIFIYFTFNPILIYSKSPKQFSRKKK